MLNSSEIDSKALRNAFGSFATGVTIVTTKGRDGNDYGLTANSFTSVSLDPPMLLWCHAEKASSFDVFRQVEYFAVHVLAADQQDISHRFATKGADKFSGVGIEYGPNDIPLLTYCVARFVCKTIYEYAGGDHIIHVGKILDFSENDMEPLIFHKGKYTKLA